MKLIMFIICILLLTEMVSATPTISYVSPTLDNNSQNTTRTVIVNTTTTNSVSSFLDWNQTLSSWWKLNNNTGTVAIDSIGSYNGILYNMNTGIDNGTDGWDSDCQLGNCTAFDGFNSNITVAGAGNYSDDITIITRIKPYSVLSAGSIIDKNGYGDYNVYYTGPTSRSIEFIIENTSFDAGTANNIITYGSWSHVAVTFDKDLPVNQMKTYVNGTLQATMTRTTVIPTSPEPLIIGNWAANNRTFNGSIDDVKIFHRVLSADEIQADYLVSTYPLNTTLSNIPNGTASYTGYTQDSSGVVNNTETRYVTVGGTTNSPPSITSITNQSMMEIYSSQTLTATANQTIDTWTWYVNSVDQNHNSNTLELNSTIRGTLGYINVIALATNANGTSAVYGMTIDVNQFPEVWI